MAWALLGNNDAIPFLGIITQFINKSGREGTV